jgi:hypothetical protein
MQYKKLFHKDRLIMLLVILLLSSMFPTLTFSEEDANTKKYTVEIKGTSDKLGNIFREGETPNINLELESTEQISGEVSIHYKVLSYDDRLWVKEEMPSTLKLGGNEKTVSVQLDEVNKNGTYTLMVDVLSSNGTIIGHQDVRFSIAPVVTNIPDNPLLAVNTHFTQGKGDPEKLLSITQAAGFRSIRDSYHLPENKLTRYPDIASDKGIETFIMLNIPSIDENGNVVGTDEHAASYAKKSKEIASKLKGKVKYFEIGNEFNGGFSNPERLDATYYYKILKAAYPAIKEANPDAEVVAGAMILSDYGWAEQLLASGGAQVMDVFSFHPYTNQDPVGGGFVDSITKLKEVLEQGGFDGPVWITEMGWQNSTRATGVNEVESASYIAQTYVLGMANPGKVDRIYYYDMNNDGISPEDPEQNFGLVRADDYSAKLSYISFTAFAKLIGNATYKKSYEFGKNIQMYRFSREADEKDVLVVWSSGGPKSVGIKLGMGSKKLFDTFGNSIGVTEVKGSVQVTLSKEPIYIEGEFPEDIDLTEPAFRLEKNTLNGVPGNQLKVTVLRSASGSKLSGEYDVKLPEGWTLLSNKPFGKSKQDEITIQIPNDLKQDESEIEIDAINDKGQRLGHLKLSVKQVEPFVVNVAPFPANTKDWNEWGLAIGLSNNDFTKVIEGGTVTIVGPEPRIDGINYDFPDLKPGDMHTLNLPLSTTDTTVLEEETVIPVSQGKPATADSEETGKGNLAGKAFDGLDNTRWCANDGAFGHWLKVDLEDVYDLMGTEVIWESKGQTYKYKIEVSLDDVNWITVVDKTNSKEKAQIIRDRFNAEGRYVRITSTDLDPGRWASIGEFKVYDTVNPMPEEKKVASDKLTLKVQSANSNPVFVEKSVTFLAAVFADQPIVIDGDLTKEEWDGAMTVEVDVDKPDALYSNDWKGISDLSLKLKTKWDANYLYVAAYVTDDVHYQPFRGSSIWQADGLQFATEPNRVSKPGSGGWNEIGCAGNSDDQAVEKYRWTAISGKIAGDFGELQCAVKRVLNVSTLYEMAIPWSEILLDYNALEPGLDIGFSLLANDNDGNGRDGFIQYMSGIGKGKNPTAFGDLILTDPNGKFEKAETAVSLDDDLIFSDSNSGSQTIIAIAVIAVILAAAAVYLYLRKKRRNSYKRN